MKQGAAPPRIFTVGHSTRTIEELVGLLKANGVGLLARVRRSKVSYPG